MDLRAPRDSGRPAASLLRPTDRARRALRRAQLLLGLLAVAIAVPIGVGAAADAAADTAPPGGVERTVQAQLLDPAFSPDIAITGADVPTPALWSAPDGVTHTGLIWAEAGLPDGARVTVVLDAGGRPAGPRVELEDPRTTGLLAGVATVLGCWVLLALGSAAARARLAAFDADGWADGWARVEPVWSGRTTP